MCDQVILVDDEKHVRTACTQALELAGLSVQPYERAEQALERVQRNWPGIIVTDIKMPGTDGLQLMNMALDIDPELPVIIITGHGDIPMAISAVRAGAYEFIEKPFASEALTEVVKSALEVRKDTLANRGINAGGDDLSDIIIGNAGRIKNLRESIIQFGKTDADVLINGETGAGKELVARALHLSSPRADEKFFAINCGALAETVIESELFGHEPGSFTGANKRRIGKFEYASGGTLFLDEIESMPMSLQIKLLRVLQEREIERLGSNELIPIDVRFIAATKKDLKLLSDEGKFREDLFYRLNILAVKIPPLRERLEDVPLLFKHFVKQATARYRCEPPEITPRHITALMQYDWPGNVRELQNTALRFSLGLGIITRNSDPYPEVAHNPNSPLSERVSEVEKQIIEQELKKNSGNLKATYEALGISRKTLYDKIRKYELDKLDIDTPN